MRVVIGEDTLAALMLQAAKARRLLDEQLPAGEVGDCLEALAVWAEDVIASLEVAA